MTVRQFFSKATPDLCRFTLLFQWPCLISLKFLESESKEDDDFKYRPQNKSGGSPSVESNNLEKASEISEAKT